MDQAIADMPVARKKKGKTPRPTRTITQEVKAAKLPSAERKKYIRKTDVLDSVQAKLMSDLTDDQVAELNKVQAHDVPNLVVKEGDIVGVLDDDLWLIRRVLSTSPAGGTRKSTYHLTAAAAADADGGEGSIASASDEDDDGDEEDEAGGDHATDAHRKLSAKNKKTKGDKARRQQKRGSNANTVQTVKDETLAYVVRSHFEQRVVNNKMVEVIVPEPLCFQYRRIASADVVRKHGNKYQDLTAFDTNRSRSLRDIANLRARKESQDEGFDAAAVKLELAPGEVKQGSEVVASLAAAS
uniref:Uncharacterized protein n=1 Tax=Neobodo designis TaxID=312471 RepID=A0A7S1M7B0_NEODS